MNNKLTLEERIGKARELRGCGRNCAQSVIMAFPDVTGLDDETAARISNAFGSGVAATGEICGVASGIAMVTGMIFDDTPASKVAATKCCRPIVNEFASRNNGCLRCADLKRPGAAKSCESLIMEGIEILHTSLNNQQGE